MNVLAHSDELGIKVTETFREYGSFELVEEVRAILESENYIGIKNHGVIAIGDSLESAGALITENHNKGLALKK